MRRRLHEPVRGQLGLLELLDQALHSYVEDEVVMEAAVDVELEVTVVAGLAALGERDRALLSFASRHHMSRRRDELVRQELRCSPTRYVQLLTALLDRADVAAAEPDLVAGLRELRDRRQRLRAAGRGE